jgi:hypothetical protein
MPLNAESFNAATFTNPVTGMADPAMIAAAFKLVVREYNRRIAQFVAVGDAGYVVLRQEDLAPPAQKTEYQDLRRTVWEFPIEEGDWVLPRTNPDVIGS